MARNVGALASGILLICAAASCAGDPMAEVRAQYALGRYGAAYERVSEILRNAGSDEHLYRLERAIVALALRDPRRAVQDLRIARDRLDEVEGADWSGWIQSMFLDDRQLVYQGADYERVMVRALLAAAEAASGGGDAMAYALQVLAKQERLIASFRADDGSRPKEGYKLVAFGSYLAAILDEERLLFDRARRQLERVREIEPGFPTIEEDLRRVTEGHHSEKGNGVVWVLALVGRGPFRIEVNEPVSQSALAIAQVIWAISRKRATIPNILEVKIPAIAVHGDNPTEVHVETELGPAGATLTVTDVDETAIREFEAMRPYIVARAVVRRAFKIVVTEAMKEVARPRGRRRADEALLVDLAISAAGLVWTAFERADLRCWSLLPAKLQVLRVELPAGEHEIVLRAGRHGQPTGAPQRCRVVVRDGFNTYVLVLAPTLEGGPPPLASESAEEPTAAGEAASAKAGSPAGSEIGSTS